MTTQIEKQAKELEYSHFKENGWLVIYQGKEDEQWKDDRKILLKNGIMSIVSFGYSGFGNKVDVLMVKK